MSRGPSSDVRAHGRETGYSEGLRTNLDVSTGYLQYTQKKTQLPHHQPLYYNSKELFKWRWWLFVHKKNDVMHIIYCI